MAQGLIVTGHWGVGDCIHQIAVLRELMKDNDVHHEPTSTAMFHDLVINGNLKLGPTRLNPRMRESSVLPRSAIPTSAARRVRIGYNSESIKRHGSILAAQFASVGLRMPDCPDFSFTIPQDWVAKADRLIAGWNMNNRPLLIYRPIVLSDIWKCPARSPDPAAYAALFAPLRDRFFVVSIADLGQKEHIVGPTQNVDVELNHGELDFETLAALVAKAKMVFANAGFMPVLAQAVHTPVIVIYGGNESFRTTNSVGARLAATLAIDVDNPCECHSRSHACDKRITLPPAHEKIMAFVERQCD